MSRHCIEGYDMEDAMVINKASAERGFAYGSIYKSEVIAVRCRLCVGSAVYMFV